MLLKLSAFLSSSYTKTILSWGGLTIFNKGTTLWSSSVVKQPPRGCWKCVLHFKSSAGLGKRQSREEVKPRQWKPHEPTPYWQHAGLCQISRLILGACKFDWKGMQMLLLICIILSCGEGADIVTGLDNVLRRTKQSCEPSWDQFAELWL